MSQLSLFEELDQEQEKLEAALAAEKAAEMQKLREEASQPKQCDHCGDWEPNRYLWDINHGNPSFYDMPGACVKHWAMFNQARWDWGTNARTWLEERNFPVPTAAEGWSK